MSKLNEKQKAFADYYIESLNAYESAKSSDVAIILFYEAKIFFDDGKQLDLALEKLNSIDLSELLMPVEFIDSYYSFLIRIYFTKNDYNAILPLFEKIKNPNDDDVYFTSPFKVAPPFYKSNEIKQFTKFR